MCAEKKTFLKHEMPRRACAPGIILGGATNMSLVNFEFENCTAFHWLGVGRINVLSKGRKQGSDVPSTQRCVTSFLGGSKLESWQEESKELPM